MDLLIKFDLFSEASLDPWKLISEPIARKTLSSSNKTPYITPFSSRICHQPPHMAFSKFPLDLFFKKIRDSTNSFLQKAKFLCELEEKVSFLTIEELKHFFGVISLMQDYHYPDYRDHFKIDKIIQSPIAKLMSLGRFQILLKYLELDIEEICSENYSDIFLQSMELPEVTYEENLILIQKKLHCNNKTKLLLLYDEKGFLLKGCLLKEIDEIESINFQAKIEGFLESFAHKNHCLILPYEIFSLNFLEELQKNQKFRCLGLLIKDSELPYSMQKDDFLKGTIYCYNKEKKLILLKKYDVIEKKINHFIIGNSILFQKIDEEIELSEEVQSFIDKSMENINKLWKISIWKEFDQQQINPSIELLFFIFRSFLINAYILFSANFEDFSSYKNIIINNLISKENEDNLKKSNGFHRNKNSHWGHFPEKMERCKVCKVCLKDAKKFKKSMYKCGYCSKELEKNICLCVSPCFEVYHSDIKKYNEKYKRKNDWKKVKVD